MGAGGSQLRLGVPPGPLAARRLLDRVVVLRRVRRRGGRAAVLLPIHPVPGRPHALRPGPRAVPVGRPLRRDGARRGRRRGDRGAGVRPGRPPGGAGPRRVCRVRRVRRVRRSRGRGDRLAAGADRDPGAVAPGVRGRGVSFHRRRRRAGVPPRSGRGADPAAALPRRGRLLGEVPGRRGEPLLQPSPAPGARADRPRGLGRRSRGERLARPGVRDRLAHAGAGGVGLVRADPRRRARPDALPAADGGRRALPRRRHAAGLRRGSAADRRRRDVRRSALFVHAAGPRPRRPPLPGAVARPHPGGGARSPGGAPPRRPGEPPGAGDARPGHPLLGGRGEGQRGRRRQRSRQ